MSEDVSQLEQQAAEQAVELVRLGMVVGLARDVIVASDQGIGHLKPDQKGGERYGRD